MLRTNCEYLRAEIMDVLRAFGKEDMDCTHYFSYSKGEFLNCIQSGDKFYDFVQKAEPEDDEEYKRLAKRYSKLSFYEVLSSETGMTLPWGALTGIRPTKMAYREKEKGRDFKSLFSSLHVSDVNISLIGDVIKSQEDIYRANKLSGVDVYVSIPFCPTKCEYCSFITAPIEKTRQYVEAYVNALCREIESLKEICPKINSLYIGGGTPFTLDISSLERIFSSLQKLDFDCEYTVEAGRPDTFSDDKLNLCRDFGVNRICVNPQSFKDETLKKIGRKHTAKDIYGAYEMAKKYGFEINLDLIAGLADETAKDVEDSVKKAMALEPDDITVHTLCLKAGARLKEETKRIVNPEIDDMIALSRALLYDGGYKPYYLYRQKYQAGGNENTGWFKKTPCVYNIDTMEEICSNVAVGADGISKRVFAQGRIERLPAPKDIKTYLEKYESIIQKRCDFFR